MHLSFKDGPRLAKEIGCRALQIFCGNPRGWQKSPLDPEFVKSFRAGLETNGIDPLVVHATYLINPAAKDDRFYKLSCDSMTTELQRAAQVAAKFYVLHIGNHMGAGPEVGRKKVAECMRAAAAATPNGPEILVENTCGSGTTLGTTFEEIKALMDEVQLDRLGLCLDTCHALAAGYDIRTPAGVKEMFDNIDRTIGLKRLRCLHVNDSKGAVGSKLDRHEHIGKGEIGRAGFSALFSDPRVWHLPAILETPRENTQDEWDNLWAAIDLASAAGAITKEDMGERPARPVISEKKSAAAKAAKPEKKTAKKPKSEAKTKTKAKGRSKK
jgi:deoxyribonuclease-4